MFTLYMIIFHVNDSFILTVTAHLVSIHIFDQDFCFSLCYLYDVPKYGAFLNSTKYNESKACINKRIQVYWDKTGITGYKNHSNTM